MSAAERAAAYRGLIAEPSLAVLASDRGALDEFCSLSRAVENAGVSDAALAAACADAEQSIATVARVLLAMRGTLRAASPGIAASTAIPGTQDRFEIAASSLAEALDIVARDGFERAEVPRDVVAALGVDDPPAIRVLRAAFSSDDRSLVEALAGDFDVAELKAAERLAGQRSLRAGLRTTGAAFRGIGSRERAVEWFDRLEVVRRGGRKRRGALRAAVEATGVCDADVAKHAASADAVWDSLDDPPSFGVRAALLCDALSTARISDDFRLVPIGTDTSHPARIDFDDAPGGAVDVAAFATAIGCDGPLFHGPHVRVRLPANEVVARFLQQRGEAENVRVRLDRPLPESGGMVVAPRMTFSASRLNMFVKCPRRFFYEYLCDAVDERTTSNAVYGKVFHAALEALHREVRIPSAWQRGEVLDKLCLQLDAAFGVASREFESELEYAVLRLRARQVARHYVRWLFEETADAPLEISDVEERHDVLLGDHRFVGYIDRVDRPAGGGPVTILDYKTGRIEEDPEEYLRQVRTGDEAQLALYYAMRRARGDQVARIALVSIRDARDRTWVLALDIADESGKSVAPRRERAGVLRATCSLADLEASLAALTRRCDEITTEGFDHFAVGDDPPCSYCAYAASCRERPDDQERIFAR
ncbi:MAG TPA: PD-(D/E)XK nuclease family protein [Candidatus Eremiobacteraceae bacterium]|nr:PD-(D/E)XK nuclease family protein [Candidatus Eremiobacteraceae bacterium]